MSVLFIFGCSHTLYAQNTNVSTSTDTIHKLPSDSTQSIKKQNAFLVFFEKIFGFHKKKINTTPVAKKKSSHPSDSTITKTSHKKPLFDFTKGGITYTTLYSQGVNENTGVNGLYTLTHAFQNFQVFGAPFTASATTVVNDGHYESNYSTYTVHFDASAFANMLRNRAQAIETNQEAKKQFKSPINLSDSIKKFDEISKELNSPKYQTDEKACEQSLQKSQDSLEKDPCLDTTELHSLRQQMSTYMQLEKSYDRLFQLQEKYGSIDKVSTLDKGLKEPSAMDEKSEEGILMQNNQLNPYEKFLMGVQKFNIGQCNEDFTDFTFHNFMMKGGEFAYKSGDDNLAGGYGKEQAIVDPYLMTGTVVPTYNRTVEYMRFGMGTEQTSNLYATVLHISDPGSANSLVQDNWVLDLTKKVIFSKNFDIEGEIAQSHDTYSISKLDTTTASVPTPSNKNFAYSIKAHGYIPYTHTTLKATYENTQANFQSLGNPYLLTGASIYRLELTQPIGSRLFFNAGGNHTIQSLVNETANKQTDNWLDCSLKYIPFYWLNTEFKYAPRQFQEQEGTVVVNSITSTINQISFIANAINKIHTETVYSTVFLGNFQYSTPGSSTFLIQNTNLSYYMFNEVVALNDSKNIAFSGNESRNNWTGSLYQFIGQGTYNVSLKKNIKITSGLQWVEQPGIIADGLGLIGGLNGNIGKWGMLGLQLNCRNNINDLMDTHSVQVLLSSNISIFW